MAESSTFKATSFSSSFCKRSRIWRLVTYLPSRPASGLSLTEKGHFNGRIVDLHEGQRLHIGGAAQGIADGHVGQAGEATISPAVMLSHG